MKPPVDADGRRSETDFARVMAFAFGQPSRDRYEWLQKLGRFRSYEDYESRYIAVFDAGSPEPPVPLLESAHHKAVPAQQIALECMDFYEVMQLKPDTSRYAPDHLVTQLEFLSAVRYLRSQRPADEGLARLERDFTERHLLSWLPAAQKKMRKQRVPVFTALLDELVGHLGNGKACQLSRSSLNY